MTVEAVLFDVGGVIMTERPPAADVVEALGLEADLQTLDRVDAAIWGQRAAYDLDLSDRDYWTAVAADAGALPPSDATIRRLATDDAARWSRPQPDVLELIGELAGLGLRLGVLSNAPQVMARSFASQPWAGAFEVMVFSCDTLVAKPDERAFQAALGRFSLPAEKIVFFDDRAHNVDASRVLGIQGHVWAGPDEARRLLANQGVLFRRG